MTQSEQDLKDLQDEKHKLYQFCSQWFRNGGSDLPKPTDQLLASIADMFEMRCSDRDYMAQRLQETLANVVR